ncbi:MOSC domain-containing protein [Sphingobium boeckii]|uniref:MOSC domain-containing protein YiiM n=1 Tax=Sphingobium boeckii TaxID=1082345 RepID=A0A7W9AGD7_9SPHN|nr:MOSC domain-containing protein [Sphingobium boeckii]MBB5685125.1 MOSC domain-containing protein YiiM [Sphingobium boeckii]
MDGRLIGIARHGRPRGPIEILDHVHVSIEAGVSGDFRGAVKPGGRGKRQVTIMSREGWEQAMTDLGRDDLDWWIRRVNLLTEHVALPHKPGTILHLGSSVALQVTGECDPCSRMEEIAPGLKAALTPEWRGGLLCRVIAGGEIALGDGVKIEEQA